MSGMMSAISDAVVVFDVFIVENGSELLNSKDMKKLSEQSQVMLVFVFAFTIPMFLLLGFEWWYFRTPKLSPEDRAIAAVMDTKEFKEIARNLALAKLNKQRADEDVKNLEKHDALAKVSMDRFQYLSKNFIWGENN